MDPAESHQNYLDDDIIDHGFEDLMPDENASFMQHAYAIGGRSSTRDPAAAFESSRLMPGQVFNQKTPPSYDGNGN